MATRTISTKLAVEGESEYRASLTRINGEIKNLQSALRLTESQYQTNANSMAALSAKGDALNNLYAAQVEKVKELQAALENARNAEATFATKKQELTARIEENAEALEELRKNTVDTTAEQERLTAENNELNAELEKNEAYLAAAGRGVTNWQDKLNSAQIKLNDLDAELKLNDKYMDEARKSSDGCAKSIDEFGNKTEQASNAIASLAQALAAAGVVQAVEKIAEALNACVQSSVSFESALVGVAKTSGLQGEALEGLGEEIKDLATQIPVAATEIANVAEAAGQLGIAKEDLLSFTEVMVNLGASTELSSTEAASALAKFANVVSMSADDYERLGSTIVDLGNNFATTEADIVSMATRLASSGSIVGLTESEIMAVATALSSVGIEAEAGGSAISKLLKQFETMVQTGSPALADFAAVAGISAEEFSAAWGENAVEALSKFIGGLGAVDAAGGSSVAILEDLEITEVRLSNAVLALASSNGILDKALNTANNAWEENVALAAEAGTKYETTESKFQLFKNSVENVKIAVGDQLTPALGDLADTGADALNWAASFFEENEWLAPAITAVGSALGVGAVALTGYTVATNVAIPAITAFNTALSANPVGAVALAIGAATAALTVLVATIDNDAVPSVKELTTAASEMSNTMEEAAAAREATVEATMAAANVAETYITKLEEMEAAGIHTDEQARQYHNTLALLCQVVPELSGYIDLETDTIEGGTEALRANTEAWKKNAIQQAYQAELTAMYESYAEVLIEAEKNSIGLTEAQYALEAAEQKQNDTLNRMNELWNQATEEANKAREEYWYLGDATGFLSEEYYELENSLYGISEEMWEAEKSAKNYQKAMDEDAEAAAAAKDELLLTQEAVNNLTESYDENATAATENAEAQAAIIEATGAVNTQITELAKAYKEAYDAAYDSISGQIGLFDTFASEISEDTDTVEEMMARWAEQTQNLANYTENLKLAAQYGLDEGLILSLADGSAESAGYLATIIGEIEKLGGTTEGMSTDAQEFVDRFNESFAVTSEAKDAFAETVATMQTDFEEAIAAIEKAADEADFSGVTEAMEKAFADVGVDFKGIGEDAAGGFVTGVEGTTGEVRDASSKMAQSAIDATRETLDSHSDSRVMIGVGQDFVGGMVTGIEGEQPELVSTVQKMGDQISDVMTKSATDTVKRYITEFSQISNKTNNALQQLKSTVTSATAPLPNSMYSVGQQIVNGMINGMNNRSSSLYWTVSNIVNNAIAKAKSAAATASPSKKTTKIFEDVGEGMVVGLEHKRERVAETAQSIVDNALKLDVSGKVEAAIAGIDDRMPNVNVQRLTGSDEPRTITIEPHIEIASMPIREEADIHKVARELYNLSRTASRGKGVL